MKYSGIGGQAVIEGIMMRNGKNMPQLSENQMEILPYRSILMKVFQVSAQYFAGHLFAVSLLLSIQ